MTTDVGLPIAATAALILWMLLLFLICRLALGVWE